MKVELIDYQVNALDLLIYTKNTRLRSELSLVDIGKWPMKEKLDHLDYMKKTIQSSFEFVNYTFDIKGVSRSFTHQLVRTRNAVYAQESMRTVDVREAGFRNPSDNLDIQRANYIAREAYTAAIDEGIAIQDAREVLPTGTLTSITMATHLRELMHMAEVRLCKRTQGEYQEVFKAMKAEVVKVHPYFADMIEVYCVKTGMCCFPNYTECPVQALTIQISNQTKMDIKKVWQDSDHVANPKITKPGKTM